MKIGYCRVSTEEQNPDLQLAALKAAGCEKIFTDKASGATTKRPQLKKCLELLGADDVLSQNHFLILSSQKSKNFLYGLYFGFFCLYPFSTEMRR